MRTKIRQRDFYKWPAEVQRVLWKLTFNQGPSGLRDTLRDIKGDIEDGEERGHKTFVLFEDDIPVSWALAAWDGRDTWDLMLYTRMDRRRMGYGRRVYQKAMDWLEGEDYFIFPDGYNTGFFNRVDRGAV